LGQILICLVTYEQFVHVDWRVDCFGDKRVSAGLLVLCPYSPLLHIYTVARVNKTKLVSD